MNKAFIVALAAACFSTSCLPQSGPTVTLSSAVKQSHVLHAGINVDDASYLLKDNFLFDNQGFEQPTVAVTINCASLNGTVCVSDDPYARWPDGFAGGFTFRGQVAGDTAPGTVAYSLAANGTQGVTLYLNQAPTTSHLILEGTLPSSNLSDISGFVTRGSGSATVETYDVGDGRQSLLLDGSNGYQQLVRYFDNLYGSHSGTQLNAPYEVHFLAKPGSGNAVTVDVTRFLANGTEVMLHAVQQLAPGWQQYVLPFSPSENGTQIGNIQFSIEADGGTVLLDDISMPRVENTNATPFRQAALDSLNALQPGTLRYMIASGYGVRLDDAISPINLRRPALHGVTDTQAQQPSVDYFQAMQLAQAVGARPWITIPLTTTQAEMANLVEWLGGSSSTPYGAKRAARGQSAPWTSVFPTIYVEYGNEDWNSGVDGNNQNDPDTYGRRVNDVFTAAHGSSSWGGGITLVADGWSTSSVTDAGTELFWEQHVRQHISVPFMMSEAPYLYTSFNDGSSPEAIYGPLYAEVQALNDPNGGLTQKVLSDLRANGDDLGIYEENLGTNNGFASQGQFDQLTSTIGSGVAVGDNMLQLVALGIQPQNLFDYFQIAFRLNSGQISNLWGSIIDAGGATNRSRPTYLAEQLVNNALLPTMLTTTQRNDATYNMPGSSNDQLPPLSNIRDLRSYAFTDGTRTSLVLVNMSRTTSVTPSLAGFPGGAPSSILQLASASITDDNEVSQLVAPRDITGQWNGGGVSLPPFSMTTVLWNAGTINGAPAPVAPTPAPPSPAPPPPPPFAPAPGAPSSPIFTLGSGTYSGALIENITGPPGSLLYFTFDGSLPTQTHGIGCLRAVCPAGPMTFNSTLVAVACINGVCSAPTYGNYQIDPSGRYAAPAISWDGGDQTVNPGGQTAFYALLYGSFPFQTYWTRNAVGTASALSASGDIMYTPQAAFGLMDDGAQFVAHATNAGGSFASHPMTLHVIGGNGQGAPNTLASPVFSVGGGTYSGGLVENIIGPYGSVIVWTTDGSLPSATNGNVCAGAVCTTGPIQTNSTLNAVACIGGSCSSPASAYYAINYGGVLVRPGLSIQSGDQTVSAGAITLVSAAPYGSYPFSAVWKKNGSIVPSFMYNYDLNSSVVQNTFQLQDDGNQFAVTFTNQAGSYTGPNMTIHVVGGSGQGSPQ